MRRRIGLVGRRWRATALFTRVVTLGLVSADETELSVEIVDGGRGFDVEAARDAGRRGLVGMSERVRLLDGTLELDSRPGGPTRVRATIPRWRPTAES